MCRKIADERRDEIVDECAAALAHQALLLRQSPFDHAHASPPFAPKPALRSPAFSHASQRQKRGLPHLSRLASRRVGGGSRADA
jgi:hypothetical protein